MDPLSVATGTEVAKAGGGLLGRLFGPVFDQWGQQMLEKYLASRARHVAELADRRTVDDPAGAISGRVAAGVLVAAQFAEDEFVAEYLSGVLASSRTSGLVSDHGVPWTAMITRMSSDQLRLHYTLYHSARSVYMAAGLDAIHQLRDVEVLVPWEPLVAILRDEDITVPIDGSGVIAALALLEAEGLIGAGWWVDAQASGDRFLPLPERRAKGLTLGFRATMVGVSLFMWGVGCGQTDGDEFLSPMLDLHLVQDLHASGFSVSGTKLAIS